MAQKASLFPSQRRLTALMRNAPLTVCCVTLSISLEAFAAFGIVSQTPGVFGWFEAALCLSCGMASLALSGNATDLKRDPRPEVRRGAYGARIVALMLLVPSTYYVGQAFAYQKQMADWRAFHGSAEEAALSAIVHGQSGEYVDSQVRLEAAAQLARGTKPERAEFDPLSTLWAGLILSLNCLAIGVGRKPRPETESEAKRRIAHARAMKAKATREAKANAPPAEQWKPRIVA